MVAEQDSDIGRGRKSRTGKACLAKRSGKDRRGMPSDMQTGKCLRTLCLLESRENNRDSHNQFNLTTHVGT